MANKDKPPHRVQQLQKKLEEMNGDTLTANGSRSLIKLIGETQLDLWDELLEMKSGIKTLVNIAITVAVGLFISLAAWFFTMVLPNIT